jgi:hypothetical protein
VGRVPPANARSRDLSIRNARSTYRAAEIAGSAPWGIPNLRPGVSVCGSRPYFDFTFTAAEVDAWKLVLPGYTARKE